MAQSARCAALNDGLGLLALGHEPTYADAHISLFRLDAKGNPPIFGTPLQLPRPKGLEKFPHYPVSLAFHPRLPLLYVWQDIAVPFNNPPPPAPPELLSFDHLLIYNVAKDVPELVVGFCRGPEFIYGQQGGGVAVDRDGSYLYVPNLHEPKNVGSLRNGRFPLDADGLPLFSEKDAKEPMPVRLKRLTDLNTAKPLLPPQLTPIEFTNLFHITTHGCLMHFAPLGKDVVVASGWRGLLTWRPEDKDCTISALPLKHSGHTLFAIHPELPVIFATVVHSLNPDSFFRVNHAEGYLTLLPHQYTIPDSKLSSAPALMPRQSKLAIGGQYHVYQIRLDERGFPVGEVIQHRVNNQAVRALVFSERFDRLYVGVEISK